MSEELRNPFLFPFQRSSKKHSFFFFLLPFTNPYSFPFYFKISRMLGGFNYFYYFLKLKIFERIEDSIKRSIARNIRDKSNELTIIQISREFKLVYSND